MARFEAREESHVSHLGNKRVLDDPLFPSPDESFTHEKTLFDHAFSRKGKKPPGGGASQRTLFPLSTLDPQPLTLTTLGKHKKLQKQERKQSWSDFWASFSLPMDNTTATSPGPDDASASQESDPPTP